MHTHSRSMLRYLIFALLVTALIVLFPVTAKSHRDVLVLLLTLL